MLESFGVAGTREGCLPALLSNCINFFIRTVIGGFLPVLFVIFRSVCNLNCRGLNGLVIFGFTARVLISLLSPGVVDVVNCEGATFLDRVATTTKLVLVYILPRMLKGGC